MAAGGPAPNASRGGTRPADVSSPSVLGVGDHQDNPSLREVAWRMAVMRRLRAVGHGAPPALTPRGLMADPHAARPRRRTRLRELGGGAAFAGRRPGSRTSTLWRRRASTGIRRPRAADGRRLPRTTWDSAWGQLRSIRYVEEAQLVANSADTVDEVREPAARGPAFVLRLGPPIPFRGASRRGRIRGPRGGRSTLDFLLGSPTISDAKRTVARHNSKAS